MFVCVCVLNPHTHTHTHQILSRNSNFNKAGIDGGPPPEQDIPLNIPKKTKLYVEQTQREKEQCVDMHRIFQVFIQCSYSVHAHILTYILKFRRKYMGLYAHMYRFFQVYIQCSYIYIY